MESRRRQDAGESIRNMTTSKEMERINNAVNKERERQERKEAYRAELEEDSSYRTVKWIATAMDTYFLDPIIGFFIPGAGDVLTSVMTVPFIYVALFKVRSIPLTLAVIYNALIDMLLGMVPFFIGDIMDAFNRSYKKSYRLIVGFVEDDQEVIKAVNRKAFYMAVMIVIFCLLIYWLVNLVISITTSAWEWLSSLFA